MELTRKTAEGLEQRIFTYNSSMNENDMIVNIYPVDNIEALFEEDNRRFSEHIQIPHWRELVLAFPYDDPFVDPTGLELDTVTSYHVQAIRKANLKGITPVTILGILNTSDNKLVYGIRGGQVGAGQANAVPGGHVTPSIKYSTNPIFSSFYDELICETGLMPNEVSKAVLIGHQTDPKHKSLCFVMDATTPHESGELYEIHRKAFEVYTQALKSGKPELEARKAIADAGLPNIDAWENRELVFLQNESDYIQKIIELGEIEHKGHRYQTFDNSIGALIIYKTLREQGTI